MKKTKLVANCPISLSLLSLRKWKNIYLSQQVLNQLLMMIVNNYLDVYAILWRCQSVLIFYGFKLIYFHTTKHSITLNKNKINFHISICSISLNKLPNPSLHTVGAVEIPTILSIFRTSYGPLDPPPATGCLFFKLTTTDLESQYPFCFPSSIPI